MRNPEVMSKTYKPLTVRVPASIADKLKAHCKSESERLGEFVSVQHVASRALIGSLVGTLKL